MNIVNVNNCQTLLLGRRGENEVTEVIFDFSEWASEFGPGVIDLYAQRNGDAAAYPVLVTTDGTTATWIVTATDTNVAGIGRAEYVYRIDGKIAKSTVFQTCVMEDIGQPTSTPPDPYESWLEQLTALGAETEAHAQAAEQSAENAAESAEDAAQSATSAEGYAGQAETAAGLAQTAQTASEAARDAAQTAQASAEASATAASGSAGSAAGSATAAAGSASDASASASAAGASASAAGNAATQAESAKTAAQTAQSAAEDAAEDAQQAAQQAHVEYEQLSDAVDDLSDEVSQQKSAIDDLTALTNRKAGMLVDTASGAVASFFPDSTIHHLLGVSVAIEPVQDLHGYDSPWPAGGGKNKFGCADGTYAIGSTRTVIVVGGVWTYRVNSAAASGVFLPEATVAAMSIPSLQPGTYTFSLASNAAASSVIASAVLNLADGQTIANGGTFTISADTSVVSITTSISGQYAVGTYTCQIQIENGTSVTAWTPYSNECPISGWDAVEVERASDNLLSFDRREVYQSNFTPTTPVDFSKQYVFNGYASTGYRFNNQAPDDIVYAEDNSVAFTAKSAWYGIGWNVKISPGMTYTNACDNLVGSLHIAFYDEAGLYISRVTGASQSFTAPANAKNAIVMLCNATAAATSAQRIRLLFGTTDKGYVQPVSTTNTIALGETVYGAKLTISEDGSVTALIDRAMVDLGTFNWVLNNKRFNSTNPAANAKNGNHADCLCSVYKPDTGAATRTTDGAICFANNGYIYVYDTSFIGDASAFKAAMSGVQLVYKLETPITIQLDPVTIATIAGQTNNVWADAGDVSVEFAADLKTYIDQKIAAAVAALS